MTAEPCPTCGLWWRGMEHSCRLPIYSTSTAWLSLADTDPRDAEIARLRAALDGLVEAAEAVTEPGVWTDEVEARIAYWKRVDALRAALATAKEVIDGA
jgi:hypothetical protein